MSVDLNKGATVELVKVLSDDIRLESDGSIYPSAGDAVRAKAGTEGSYPNMTAGNGTQLLSDSVVNESEPYLFRKSGGSAEIGDREEETIVGGTIAWNQLQKNTVSRTTGDITFAYSDGALTVSGTATANAYWLSNNSNYYWNWYKDHIYLIDLGNEGWTGSSDFYWYVVGLGSGSSQIHTSKVIVKATANISEYLQARIASGVSVSTPITFKPQVFDLTQMFGSTIADYIYNLEQASAGAGVAWFRSLFPKPYYAYDAGSLVSVEGLQSHDTVGKNLIPNKMYQDNSSRVLIGTDESTGYNLHLLAGTYTVSMDASKSASFYISWEGQSSIHIGNYSVKSATFTLDKERDVTLHVYLAAGISVADIKTVQLEFGSTATAYEPYHKHSYALDSSLTLRGIPKLVNGQIQFDGDTYSAEGKVTRRYGIVDLGTLTWSYNTTRERLESGAISTLKPQSGSGLICPNYVTSPSPIGSQSEDKTISGYSGNKNLYVVDSSYTDAATFKTAMSGVYLVYELETPTEETADPYQSIQIVDPNGTEQYVCETEADVIVPVGHSTKYHADLKGKIEGLPKDFSTLIAPTEAEYKATQSYAVNDLVIVNNILYKVTASIANGGTITPNTNVTQTTLSALIKALSA